MRKQEELNRELLAVAGAYMAVRPVTWKTLGTRFHGNIRFFERIRNREKSYTVRKFDEVMQEFSDCWPEGAVWPADIWRPKPKDLRTPPPYKSSKRVGGYTKPAWWDELHPNTPWKHGRENNPNGV